MGKCDLCNTDYFEGQKFCKKCGKKLVAGGEIPTISQQIGGNTAVRIYLVDNSYRSVLINDSTTVESIILELVTKMELKDPEKMKDYFGLYECLDGSTIGRLYEPKDSLVRIMKTWDPAHPGIVLFMVKLYVTETLQSVDAPVQHMLFIQYVYNVIHSSIPVDEEMAEKLAALQILDKYREYNPALHRPGFLKGKLVQYIPTKLLKSNPGKDWEDGIFLKMASIMEPTAPSEQYIKLLEKNPLAGTTLFPGDQFMFRDWPTKVFFGVSRATVCIVDETKTKILETYKMTDILRWGFTDGEDFYFELHSASCGRCGDDSNVTIETKMGKSISILMTAYAQELCKELRPESDESESKD